MGGQTTQVKTNARPTWDEFWFTIALFYSTRGTCDRLRAACILVDKNNHLIGAGYNGSLPGDGHCDEIGHLMVDGHCLRTLHSEVNAILHNTGNLENASAYILGIPCIDCVKKLLQAGVRKISYVVPEAKTASIYTCGYEDTEQWKYVLAIASKTGGEIKRVDLDLRALVAKMMNRLCNEGGAFAGSAGQI